VFTYPAARGEEPVGFNLIMIQDGATIVGFTKERNTFGTRPEPWLHAVCKATFDANTGKWMCTKTYDGTAGPDHDVAYVGQLNQAGTKIHAEWTIRNETATATLERSATVRAGAFTGLWSGTFHYPRASGRDSVEFKLLVIHDGQKLIGFTKETNTFGRQTEPWLHADIVGRLDEKRGKLTFTKTYNGTAEVDHTVQYSGAISADLTSVEGDWDIPGKISGRFTLRKLPLDARTVGNLR